MAQKINHAEISYVYGLGKNNLRVLTDIIWKQEYTNEDWSKSNFN